MTLHSATGMSTLIQAIRAAYHLRKELPEDKRWDKDLAFVFAVGDADRYTALISQSANTGVVATGRGRVGPPAAPADLAAGVTIGVSNKQLIQVNQTRAVGRFYRAYRLDPTIFKRWDREPVVPALDLVLLNAQYYGYADDPGPGTFGEVFQPS